MLIKLTNEKITSTVIIPKSEEPYFLEVNKGYMSTDFNFVEDLDLYIYNPNNKTFNLIDNWETIKAEKEAEIEAQRLAELEANKPTFSQLQAQKISALHRAFDDDFEAYLAKYPKAEVRSFDDKAKEAIAYRIDNTAHTPYISSMTGGDETLRVALINAVWAKVQYRAMLEGQMISKRDSIKACTTVEELKLIEI